MTIKEKISLEQLRLNNLIAKNNYYERTYKKCQSIFDTLIDFPRDLYITAAELYYICDEKEKEMLAGGVLGAGAVLNILEELYPSLVEKRQAFHKNIYHIPAHLKDLKA